ncbi:MAG: hypothetical protein ACTTJG_05120 [Treponema sp.]
MDKLGFQLIADGITGFPVRETGGGGRKVKVCKTRFYRRPCV